YARLAGDGLARARTRRAQLRVAARVRCADRALPRAGRSSHCRVGACRRTERAVKHACIALHDVAPATWPLCMRVFEMLAEFGGAPLTLLVVPDFHVRGRVDAAPEFVRAIETRLARGDEVALHGYDHRDSAAPPRTPLAWLRRRVLTAGEGEFSALARNEASARLERGLALMQRLRWPVRGFVPPAWLASCDVRAVLHESGLDYTTTHGSLIDLRRRSAIAAPCITASA